MQSSNQRDLHFALGENRVSAADYRGAIRSFEESLEVNRHSAAVHFELGWLYDQKVSDPATAIYHYERYLQFEPGAGNADVVKQRIAACKQKLAAVVFSLPSTVAEQRQLAELVVQHQRLQDELRRLRAGWNSWSAYYTCLMTARTDLPSAVSTPVARPPAVRSGSVQSAQAVAAAQPPAVAQTDQFASPALPAAGVWCVHAVVARETAFRIARRYGVTLEALLAANPGLEPRRMSVGLALNIPLRRHSLSSIEDDIRGNRGHAAIADRATQRLD